jgi:hypothetical protein
MYRCFIPHERRKGQGTRDKGLEAAFVRKLRKLAYGYSHGTSSRLKRPQLV